MSYPNFNLNHFQKTGWNQPIQQAQHMQKNQPSIVSIKAPINNPKPKSTVQQNPRVAQLESDIVQCTYHPDNSISVYNSVLELLKNYLNLDSSVFSYSQGKNLVTVIQLKGVLEINNSIIFFNIMLPQKFPGQAPLIRIINKQPEYLEISPAYKAMISVNDPHSILIRSLMSAKNWNSQSKIINLMKEVQTVLSKDHPFRQKQKPIKKQNPIPFIKKEQNKNTNQNKAPTRIKIVSEQSAPSPNKPASNKNKQIIQNQLADMIVRGNNFIEQTKKLFDPLMKQHNNDFTAIHNLQIQSSIVGSEIDRISAENEKSNKLFSDHDNDGSINLDKIIYPMNEWSRTLFQLICIEKADQDTLSHLEQLYSNQKITFEQLLKFTRKTQEERFMCKAMIKKKLANKQ